MTLVSVAAPTVLAASDEERAAARSLAEQGSRAYAEQRFDDAVDLFTRAEGVVHSPVHLLFIARAHVELGQLVKAQEAYVKITREQLGQDAPEAFHEAAREAAAELEVLKPRIPYLTIRLVGVEAGSAQVLVDGEAIPEQLVGVPMPVDPGNRTLEATAEGYQAATRELAVGEGHSADVELELKPVAAPVNEPVSVEPATLSVTDDGNRSRNQALRYGAYGALGVGAIGLGVGTYFILDAASTSSDADDLARTCRNDACRADVAELDEDAASSRTASLIGFIVGGVGIGTGITLWVLSSEGESNSTAARVVPWVGYKSLGVSGTF